jgi:hypothetical protein
LVKTQGTGETKKNQQNKTLKQKKNMKYKNAQDKMQSCDKITDRHSL